MNDEGSKSKDYWMNLNVGEISSIGNIKTVDEKLKQNSNLMILKNCPRPI